MPPKKKRSNRSNSNSNTSTTTTKTAAKKPRVAKVAAGGSQKKCDPGKIYNPATKRCVYTFGDVGIGVWMSQTKNQRPSPTGQRVIIMVGSTGSGKTRRSARLAQKTNAIIVSSDQYKSDKRKINERLVELLERKQIKRDIILDATNPSASRRAEIAAIARYYGATTHCIRIDVPFEVSAERSHLPAPQRYMATSTFQKFYQNLGTECDTKEVIEENKEEKEPRNVPEVMLAHKYQERYHKGPYYMSEKLDGIRAIAFRGKLYSRNGLIIHAPQWFLDSIPEGTYDGELWTRRADFQKLSSIVKKKVPRDDEWKLVSYRIFDDPTSSNDFSVTYNRLKKKMPICTENTEVSVCVEKQTLANSHNQIMKHFREIRNRNGEGIVLRKNAPYKQGVRTEDMLKVKEFKEREAKIVGFTLYEGTERLKSLICEWKTPYGHRVSFKVFTGISEGMKHNSGKEFFKIGDVVTIQFYEYTKNGLPRFPVFKGVRTNINENIFNKQHLLNAA